MDDGNLPHLRARNKRQQQSRIDIDTSGSAWSGKLPSTIRDPSVVKPNPSTWNEHVSQASSSKASTRQQPTPKPDWDGFAGEASSSKAPIRMQQPASETNLQDMPPPHLRGKPAAVTQAPNPTPPMNAGKVAKSAKHNSKVPCTFEDCTRGFTNETDMKRHKDEDHEWCRLCNVDCADDLALLEHKVLSDAHICCDFCGEDFRSEMGKERHMRQVRS